MIGTLLVGKSLVPIAILALTGVAAFVQYNRKDKSRGMTANEFKIFEALMNSTDDPAKLRIMSRAFEAEGFKEEAQLLLKRASLRELPAEEKAKRKEIFRKALRSDNIDALKLYADGLHEEGATGAEQAIRKRIAGLIPKAA